MKKNKIKKQMTQQFADDSEVVVTLPEFTITATVAEWDEGADQYSVKMASTAGTILIGQIPAEFLSNIQE